MWARSRAAQRKAGWARPPTSTPPTGCTPGSRTRCVGKDTGPGHVPSRDFALNTAWLTAAMTAQILAWLRLLALGGDLARAGPKTLCYPHHAARLTHGGRRRHLNPWAH